MSQKLSKKTKVSEVISIVAHQLKNPISVLKGYLEALISEDFGRLNQKQKEYLSDSLENIKRMIEIVSNLLDVSKIESGKYEMKPATVDLKKIAGQVINDFSLWIQASNCEIALKTAARKDFLAKADPLKIRQVIENLISNAIKYKSKGRSKIVIFLKKINKKIIFSCQDNGIGIPKEDFKNVFTKFYRSEKALEVDPNGSGLGLYIDKAIINLSGGKIWFKRNKDHGTTFYFTLPLAR